MFLLKVEAYWFPRITPTPSMTLTPSFATPGKFQVCHFDHFKVHTRNPYKLVLDMFRFVVSCLHV